jgi:hypothetical protein
MAESSRIAANSVSANSEWQLGPEPRESDEFIPLVDAAPLPDLSAARLAHPIQVLTVEHLAWGGLAIWALITRIIGLGTVPLAPNEARHALFAYDLVNRTNWAAAAGYHPGSAGWIHLVEAALFATAGPGDSAARLIFVVAGLLLIASVSLMRSYIGRAGALAAAGLITLSPTFAFFSRSSAIAIVAAALAMLVIYSFMEWTRRVSLVRTLRLGCAAGLLCASGAAGFLTGEALLAALTLLGMYQLIIGERPFLNINIWLARHGSMLAVAVVTAAIVWSASQISLFTFTDITKDIHVSNGFGAREYVTSSQYYALALLLYEFLITLAAITGVVVIISVRTRTQFTLFSLSWLITIFLVFVGSRTRESERLVLILLPLVMMGALGIDYLHHTKAWPYARIVLIGLGAVTLYVQILTNFIYAAPPADEPPWARHANLYWREGAMATEARSQLNEIRRRFPQDGGTVFNHSLWQPSLRWYLRDFRPSGSARTADLVINSSPPAAVQDSDLERPFTVDLEERWEPALDTISLGQSMRFILTAESWIPLQNDAVSIRMRPSSELAPTLVLPPPSS